MSSVDPDPSAVSRTGADPDGGLRTRSAIGVAPVRDGAARAGRRVVALPTSAAMSTSATATKNARSFESV